MGVGDEEVGEAEEVGEEGGGGARRGEAGGEGDAFDWEGVVESGSSISTGGWGGEEVCTSSAHQSAGRR